MSRFLNRLLSCLCILALALPAGGALAEFSPRLDALRQQDELTIELTGSFDALEKLSKQSLETVNGWLAPLKVTAWGKLSGGVTAAQVTSGDEELLSVVQRRTEDGVVTSFAPSGNAYLTGDHQPNALSLLTGTEWHLFDPLEIPALYTQLAHSLYPILEGKTTAKAKKAQTRVKNAAVSPSYIDYVFKADVLNEAWPEILSAILPSFQTALADQPQRSAELEAVLEDISFVGECRFKRMLDSNKDDMGMQFTGQVEYRGEQRKVTIYGGYTKHKGGYISIKMPQVKGKNDLTLQFSLALTHNKPGLRVIEADVVYKRIKDGVKEDRKATVLLRNTVKNGDENWTGKITVTETEKKNKITYAYFPDLIFTDAGLSGRIAVQRKEGSRTAMKASVKISVAPGAKPVGDAAEDARDLRDMTVAKAHTAVLAELPSLSAVVIRLMASLPEAERVLLTHELRTDDWMSMPEEEPAQTDAAEDEADDGEADQDAPGTDGKSSGWQDADDDEEWPGEQAGDPASEAEHENDQNGQDEGDWFGDDWFGNEDAGTQGADQE